MLSRSKLNPASSVDDRCGIGNGHSPFQKVLRPGQRNVWGSQQLQTGADGSAIPKTRPKPMSKNIDPIVEIGVQFSLFSVLKLITMQH